MSDWTADPAEMHDKTRLVSVICRFGQADTFSEERLFRMGESVLYNEDPGQEVRRFGVAPTSERVFCLALSHLEVGR